MSLCAVPGIDLDLCGVYAHFAVSGVIDGKREGVGR